MKSVRSAKVATGILVAFLLIVLAFQCVSSLLGEANIFDEPKLIEFGAAYWHGGHVPFPPHHYPLLLPVINAFPLLFMEDITIPATHVDDLGKRFLWELNRKNAGTIITLCRLPTVALSLLLGLVIFLFARDAFGKKAGLFALFLYVFSPSILAHSRYVHLDLGAACFGSIALYRFWKYTLSPNRKNLIISGLTLGLALLSKHSNLVLLPVFAMAGVMTRFKVAGRKENPDGHVTPLRETGRLFAILLIALATVALFYTTINNPAAEVSSCRLERFGEPSSIMRTVIGLVDRLSLGAYVDSLRELTRHARGGHSAFLAGDYSFRGWWHYYLFTFMVKTPVPLLILLIIALAFHWKRKKGNIARDTLLLMPIVIIFLLSMRSGQNIGHRHILFVYPLLHIFIAGAVSSAAFRNRGLTGAIAALAVWYAAESVAGYPHFLAYFNQFVGGPDNGYRSLVDSNCDWGQGLKGLKRYMDKRGIERIKLAYFGTADPDYYGIEYEYLPCSSLPRPPDFEWNIPTDGLIAISATELQSVYFVNKDTYAWLRRHEPIDSIGHAILIYDIR